MAFYRLFEPKFLFSDKYGGVLRGEQNTKSRGIFLDKLLL